MNLYRPITIYERAHIPHLGFVVRNIIYRIELENCNYHFQLCLIRNKCTSLSITWLNWRCTTNFLAAAGLSLLLNEFWNLAISWVYISKDRANLHCFGSLPCTAPHIDTMSSYQDSLCVWILLQSLHQPVLHGHTADMYTLTSMASNRINWPTNSQVTLLWGVLNDGHYQFIMVPIGSNHKHN